ncbi:hypothetical protein [Geopseudomonas aromaticivorans]
MNMIKFAGRAALVAVLASTVGCAMVGNRVLTDEDLARRAAFALDTTADQVRISDRATEMADIHFVAHTRGNSHQCVMQTAMGVVNTGALCSGAGSAHGNGNANGASAGNASCNALLKAAKRC